MCYTERERKIRHKEFTDQSWLTVPVCSPARTRYYHWLNVNPAIQFSRKRSYRSWTFSSLTDNSCLAIGWQWWPSPRLGFWVRASSKGICLKGEGREVVPKTILPFVRRVSGPFGQLLQNGSRRDILAQEATASFPSLKKDGTIEPQPTSAGWSPWLTVLSSLTFLLLSKSQLTACLVKPWGWRKSWKWETESIYIFSNPVLLTVSRRFALPSSPLPFPFFYLSMASVREWRIFSGSRKGCLCQFPLVSQPQKTPHCAGLGDQGEHQTQVNWKGSKSPRSVHSSLLPSKSNSTPEAILRTPSHFPDSSAFVPGLKRGTTDHSLISLSYQIQYLKEEGCCVSPDPFPSCLNKNKQSLYRSKD